MLLELGHHVVLHGRHPVKLETVRRALSDPAGTARMEGVVADLSRLQEVEDLAEAIAGRADSLDVLINNAGVLSVADPITPEGLDVRFVVNTIAPYRLTQRLLPLMPPSGRVINVSSAAQHPFDAEALAGRTVLSDDFSVYAQSKLALTMWSRHLALQGGEASPAIIAVNPGSMLASKMVKQAFGVEGADIRMGADILTRAALSEDFATANGLCFDNDRKTFTPPHPHALDPARLRSLINTLEGVVR